MRENADFYKWIFTGELNTSSFHQLISSLDALPEKIILKCLSLKQVNIDKELCKYICESNQSSLDWSSESEKKKERKS